MALIRIGVVLGKDGGALAMNVLTTHFYHEFTIWHSVISTFQLGCCIIFFFSFMVLDILPDNFFIDSM